MHGNWGRLNLSCCGFVCEITIRTGLVRCGNSVYVPDLQNNRGSTRAVTLAFPEFTLSGIWLYLRTYLSKHSVFHDPEFKNSLKCNGINTAVSLYLPQDVFIQHYSKTGRNEHH